MTNLTFNNLEANTSLFYSLFIFFLQRVFSCFGSNFLKDSTFWPRWTGVYLIFAVFFGKSPRSDLFCREGCFFGKTHDSTMLFICNSQGSLFVPIHFNPIDNMFDSDLIGDLSGNKMSFIFKFRNRLGQELGFFHCQFISSHPLPLYI